MVSVGTRLQFIAFDLAVEEAGDLPFNPPLNQATRDSRGKRNWAYQYGLLNMWATAKFDLAHGPARMVVGLFES